MYVMYITTYGSKSDEGIGGLYAVKLPVKGRVEDKFKGTPYSCGCVSSKL